MAEATLERAPETGLGVETRRCRRCESDFEAVMVTVGRRIRAPQLCPDCTGLETGEEPEGTVRKARLLHLLKASGVSPHEHGASSFGTFRLNDESVVTAIAAAREFVGLVKAAGPYDPVKGLMIFGPTGTGKTHLAVAIARELLLDPAFPTDGVVFDRSLRLINVVQDCYATGSSTEAVLEKRFAAPVWILDDFGTEQPSADVVRRLTDILQARALRPTVITSNLAPPDLEGRSPEFFRVVSRLGPKYFRCVQLEGPDARFRRDDS